jgi:O-antigen/teichoic acid export membrane protein
MVACVVNLVMNYFLIPLWGIQGAAVATLLSYLMCFWTRIIDARYYVPFKFNGGKNVLNMVLLLAMSGVIIADVKFVMLWVIILAAVVFALNYKALLITVNKLLKR